MTARGEQGGDARRDRAGRGPGAGPGSAHDRLTEEARATASVLLEWLGSRVDQAAAPGGYGARPAQSPGPCTWCPVCAMVAALRGEQPELTARLAEQASGLLMLLRTMAQDHENQHSHHGHHAPDGHYDPRAGADLGADGVATPPGWPQEWGDPSWWTATATPFRGTDRLDPSQADDAGGGGSDGEHPDRSAGDPGRPPRRPRPASAPRPTRRPRRAPRRDPEPTDDGRPTAAAPEPRLTGPGPRRAPAKTTSPRTAAFRPSPRASSMPAPDGSPPRADGGATTNRAASGPADAEAAPPTRPSTATGPSAGPADAPTPAPPTPARPGPAGTRAGSSRAPVQQIAVRRREDPGS